MADGSEREIPVSFTTFLISLAQSALVHLGEVADPGTGRKERNLQLARHTIDVLGVLEEKTKGNLEEQEARLLGSVLFDLRNKFVAANASG
jgi:hypothetical protein